MVGLEALKSLYYAMVVRRAVALFMQCLVMSKVNSFEEKKKSCYCSCKMLFSPIQRMSSMQQLYLASNENVMGTEMSKKCKYLLAKTELSSEAQRNCKTPNCPN